MSRDYEGREVVALDLSFPANLSPDDVVAVMRSLVLRPGARRWPLTFELRASSQRVQWLVWVERRRVPNLCAIVHASLPSVRIAEIALSELESSQSRSRQQTSSSLGRLGAELALSSSYRRLRLDLAEQVAAGLLSTTSLLQPDELLQVQWLVGWPLKRAVVKPVRSGGRSGIDQSVIESLLDRSYIPSSAADSEALRRRLEKQREPVTTALGRLAITASASGRRRQLMSSVLSGLRLMDESGVRLRTRLVPSAVVLRRMDGQVRPWVEWPCPLNAAELASVIGWPVGAPAARGVSYTGHRELPFPASVLRNESTGRSGQSSRLIGRASYPGRSGLVNQSARDALAHTHVMGPTGVGKSTLLANLIAQDCAAGRAVVVIEPKGDLIADVCDRIPHERIDDVVLIDPSDAEFAIGLDVLDGQTSGGALVETRVDGLVHIFRSLFASSWGPRTQDLLHASLLTLARSKGSTLVELQLLLTDERFRRGLTKPMADDLVLGSFWGWYESLSDGERSQVISPLLNKVRSFTLRSAVRRMIGQPDSRFTMRDVFTKRRIVLVALKRGEIGPETANLVGALLVAQLWDQTQARSAIAPEHRHPVMVYLDEFQTFMHLPTDLGDVLAQARGLGVGMTLAHQHLGQLANPALRSAVLTNARSRVVFQTGADDARLVAAHLGGGIEPNDLLALDRYEAYARLMHDGASLSPGSLTTLPLSSSLGSSGQVRQRSRQQFARPAAEVDAAQLKRARPDSTTTPETKPTTGGSRRRRAS